MRRDIEVREPERDPALATALREAYADVPLGAERAQALRARIRALAETRPATAQSAPTAAPGVVDVPLAASAHGLRFRRPIWAVPALLAATITAVLLLQRGGRAPAPVPAVSPAAAVGFSSAEQALSADVSDAEFARVVTREDDPAALLSIAVAPDRRQGTR